MKKKYNNTLVYILAFALVAVVSCGGSSSKKDAGPDSSTDTDTDTDTEASCWWQPVETGTETNFTFIWSMSSERMYAGGLDYVAQEGVIVQYNGAEWEKRWTFDDRRPGYIWGSSEDDLYVGFGIGEWDGDDWNTVDLVLSHWDGTSWTDDADAPVGWMFGFSSDDIFLVGSDYKIHHFDGTEWSAIFESEKDQGEYCEGPGWMWGSESDDMYFVFYKWDAVTYENQQALLLHYDGENFTEIWDAFPSEIHISDIYGVSADEIYVLGGVAPDPHGPEGFTAVYKYDGTSWFEIGYWDNIVLEGLWADEETSEVFVVDGSHHYDGTSWNEIFHSNGCGGDLIGGSDLEHLFTAGGTAICQYTCPEWSEI